MSKKYDEIMEHLELDDAAKERILSGIEHKQMVNHKKNNRLAVLNIAKVVLPLAAVLALAFLLPWKSFWPLRPDWNETSPSVLETDSMDASDYDPTGGFFVKDFQSAEELSKEIGYTIRKIPEDLFSYDVKHITYEIYGAFPQIRYEFADSEKDPDAYLLYRCIRGMSEEAGFEWVYEEETEIKLQGNPVSIKLGLDGKILLAIWYDGTYTHTLGGPIGLTMDELKQIYDFFTLQE